MRWTTLTRAQSRRDLHLTAWIGGHDHLRSTLRDVADLALEELRGELGLRDVVRAGAAAAPIGLGQRHDLQLGDRGEQRAWLLADALPVQEVARIVVRDART